MLVILGGVLLVGAWLMRVVVHELGHAGAALAFGAGPIGIQVEWFTGRVYWTASLNKAQHVAVLLAGSLSVALVAFILVKNRFQDVLLHRTLQFIGVMWVVLEFVNQSPVNGTDGDKVEAIVGGMQGTVLQYSLLTILAAWGAYLLVLAMNDKRIRVGL